jgi:hypothetical protein
VKRFKDEAGREWVLRLSVGLIEAVRQRLTVNLADTSARSFFALADDPVALVNVLWVLVEKQAGERQVTAADFGESLVGDAIDDATAALLEAIADFFPRRKRELFRKILEAARGTVAEAERMAIETLEDPATRVRVTAAIKAAQDEELRRALTRYESATSSADSSGSTPADSPGAS